MFCCTTTIDNSTPPNFTSTIITKFSISGSTKITKLAESNSLANPYGNYPACLCPVFTDNTYIYAFYTITDLTNAYIYKRLVKISIDSLSDDIPDSITTNDFLAIPSKGFSSAFYLKQNSALYLGQFNNKHYVYYGIYNSLSDMLISIDPETYQIHDIVITDASLSNKYNYMQHISEIQSVSTDSPYYYVTYQYIVNLKTQTIVAVADFKASDSASGLENVKKHPYTVLDKLSAIYLQPAENNKIYKDGGPIEVKFFQPEN